MKFVRNYDVTGIYLLEYHLVDFREIEVAIAKVFNILSMRDFTDVRLLVVRTTTTLGCCLITNLERVSRLLRLQ